MDCLPLLTLLNSRKWELMKKIPISVKDLSQYVRLLACFFLKLSGANSLKEVLKNKWGKRTLELYA